MKFRKLLSPPKKLNLPGWPHLIDYEKVRQSFGSPLFVLAFGSAIRDAPCVPHKKRFLLWHYVTLEKRWANDVDLLIVSDNDKETAVERVDGVPCWVQSGGSYSFGWVEHEFTGKLHLLMTNLNALTAAVKERDEDALRILGSSMVIEGDANAAEELIAKAKGLAA